MRGVLFLNSLTKAQITVHSFGSFAGQLQFSAVTLPDLEFRSRRLPFFIQNRRVRKAACLITVRVPVSAR